MTRIRQEVKLFFFFVVNALVRLKAGQVWGFYVPFCFTVKLYVCAGLLPEFLGLSVSRYHSWLQLLT